MSWRKEKREHPWATKAQAKRIASDHAQLKKRGSYQKRFHKPMFPNIPKTTTPQGKTAYQREWMRRYRNITRVAK